MASNPIEPYDAWCHNGTMRRMNLRDVPDDVYEALAEDAAANRQSLNAYVVDRLSEIAASSRMVDYLALYEPPTGMNVSIEDVVAAIRKVRDAS
ncbi:hypothetical protein MU582_13470 [Nocardioidaceae bacterium SCSIO 66511]|nr:hypothetical protein MU582_13470 [Nocardioidaceae bacterium SCSIO 66511]